MDGTQLIVSILSGGLAGGSVSTLFNRLQYWRSLRTQFYPQLNNFWSVYLLRTEHPEGRYLVCTVGNLPSVEDKSFVDHRTEFIGNLIQFNELKEARKLRRKLIGNLNNPGGAKVGEVLKIDLMPEYQAVSDCIEKVHKKLKL
jgi:hypothetical protein